jgi:hypothetical protein
VNEMTCGYDIYQIEFKLFQVLKDPSDVNGASSRGFTFGVCGNSPRMVTYLGDWWTRLRGGWGERGKAERVGSCGDIKQSGAATNWHGQRQRKKDRGGAVFGGAWAGHWHRGQECPRSFGRSGGLWPVLGELSSKRRIIT